MHANSEKLETIKQEKIIYKIKSFVFEDERTKSDTTVNKKPARMLEIKTRCLTISTMDVSNCWRDF